MYTIKDCCISHVNICLEWTTCSCEMFVMIEREIHRESFGNEIYFPCWIFRTFTLVLPGLCVPCPKWLFSVVSWFIFSPMLLRSFLNEFEMVSFVAGNTDITFVFTFHIPSCSLVRSLYFRIFLTVFLITVLSPEIATSVNLQVPLSLSRIMIPGFNC